MSKFTLLSVKPKYAAKIFSGEKHFEYRRVLPKHEEYPILIYESAPVQAVTGIVASTRFLTGSPDELWSFTYPYAGIDRETFDAYFDGVDEANALILLSAYRLEEPLQLGNRGLPSTPPQSFCYVDVDL